MSKNLKQSFQLELQKQEKFAIPNTQNPPSTPSRSDNLKTPSSKPYKEVAFDPQIIQMNANATL
jgi:hypothetical protein